MRTLAIRRPHSRLRFALLCIATMTATHSGLAAQPDKSAEIDALFAPAAHGDSPGASVIVIRDGEALHQAGYGLANLEHDVPNTPHTKFRLGSVTKSFTSTAILMLHEQGLLDIEDPVGKHLPDFPGADDTTLRHLLTHTSGLSESAEEGLLFEPGERISYSNFGYNLLGDVVAAVSGQSYEAYIQERIFQPLGMLSSGYDHHAPILRHRASGYAASADGFVNADYTDMSGPHAAGALYSTVEDMYRWDQALYTDRLVQAATLDMATTPVKLGHGREGGYGMGWMLNDYRGLREVGHGGDVTGFNSYVARFPDQRFSVVVLSNVGMRPPAALPTAGDLAHRIARMYLGDQMGPEEEFVEATVPVEILDAYVGVYELSAPEVVLSVAGSTLTVSRDGERLFSETNLGKALLRASSATEFHQEGMPLTLTFVRTDAGQATGILISAGGLREFSARRAE
ncbi:serine hydrolase [Candidatus Poribacteria bacterium]|jgi:CubicO group peptidase (beta-lactamase class C family)|nr:serine hydrolase [Candidatus Poribacteria bacterium]MBT5534955.1 serine hydrolase [Candidatus Poribacteria bacterium]MBT5709596.1 serine hydrolase [Candidatus Poribacteria bacterium]MBT7097129.1 serine hydrolase [Candidatus Poribacteria bacterium]MBT7804367.1 serine hydrolase [Candidatus Poribacteria bacterium]